MPLAPKDGDALGMHPRVPLPCIPAEHHQWRLSGGRDGCAGRVEVLFHGTWSTVCDSAWYELERRVLCRSLGCGAPLQALSYGHTLPGRMFYKCESLQPSLAYCHWVFNKSSPCYQSRAAGVVCNGTGLHPPPLCASVGSGVLSVQPWGPP